MTATRFTYPSVISDIDVSALKWDIPEGKLREAVLVISHGMMEHIARYDEMAKYLNERGIIVYGKDHLGHGLSVKEPDDLGYIGRQSAIPPNVSDLESLVKIAKQEQPSLPVFILGHSMGSFLSRQYATLDLEPVSGMILSGSGKFSSLEISFARILIDLLSLFLGQRYQSKFVYKLVFSSYIKPFEPAITPVDWITGDVEEAQAYIDDPLCGARFSLNGYAHLFQTLAAISVNSAFQKTPKDLPLIFLSGQEDPVGAAGKGIVKLVEKYRRAGVKDVEVKLYPDMRHEVQSDKAREEMFEDVVSWIKEHIDA